MSIILPYMKPRTLFHEIVRYLDHKNALLITGMRQVGKTTLMRQIFEQVDDKGRLWFDFDNPLDLLIFEDKDYNNIYVQLKRMLNGSNNRIFVFIDEIQNFPAITRVVKYLIDHYNIKFVLTGSSNFYLKNLFPESLSGRKFIFHLNPLSFPEYLVFKDVIPPLKLQEFTLESLLRIRNINEYSKYNSYYEEYLNYGGFPEVALTDDIETKRLILRNIFASFFEKDLILLSDFRDIRELRDLIRLLAPRVGSMLDITRISSELGIDRKKTYNYLEFLQGTFFISLIPRFTNSIDKSVAGGKKICFSDNGMLGLLGKVNESQLLENAIFNQLSAYGELSFYNKRNTAEIDVILSNKYAFEIKTTASEADLNKLKSTALKVGLEEYFLISLTFREVERTIYPMFI
jgi:uncharacterized protein